MPVSDDVPFPNDLALDPADNNVMYLAAWPVTVNGRAYDGGVLKTVDGGATWQRLDFPGHYVYSVTVLDGVVYATAWHHGVFRSEDGGNDLDAPRRRQLRLAPPHLRRSLRRELDLPHHLRRQHVARTEAGHARGGAGHSGSAGGEGVR